jgi:hypothetical protein
VRAAHRDILVEDVTAATKGGIAMRRIIMALVLVTLSLPAIGYARPVAASTWLVFHNVKFGYSVSYPGDWQHFKAPGTNLAIRTADAGAIFDAVAEGNLNPPAAADLRAVVNGVLAAAGATSTAKVHYSTMLVHGVKLTAGATNITRLTGQTIRFTGLVAYKARTAYVFATALVTAVSGTPRAPAPAQGRALARIVASITISGPAAG